ncbi:AAA family ATPase [Ectopseudomonas chengduensis]|nr:AAA family ATPase [Pseudomonas chengduensis]UZT80734.1 AAA family ATPase [Pseudomonas chengduensis]
MALENIPHELRSFPQWVCWKLEPTDGPKPAKVPYSPRVGKRASVTDPATWASFDEAAAAASKYDGIGFVLTDADPYSFIDLDVAEGEQPTADQWAIYNEFNSYTEQSPSKRGVHIVVRGKVPNGKRQGNVEVYSSARFMTVTGNTVRPGPIADHSAKLQAMWASMGGNALQAAQDAPDAAQTASDRAIIDQARNAANGAKFATLYAGNWQGEYPSQSEADQALINIIGFYSKNREQVARIFRASALGQRDKAKRSDYMNRMLSKAFDRDNALAKVSVQLANPFEKKASRFKPQTGEEILKTPIEQWLAKSIFRRTGVVSIYGVPKSGKSFIGFDLGCSIAEGAPFFGHNTKSTPVAFVPLEGESGYRGRIEAWLRHRNRETLPDGVRFIMPGSFNIADPQDVSELAAELPPGCVVFIDTLNRASVGLDENSGKDMGAVIEGAKTLQRLIGGLVVLVAHSGKDSAKGIRGHSSLVAALDAVVLVSREGERRSFEVQTSKDGSEGEKHFFRLEVVEVGTDEDGDAITSCVVVPEEAPALHGGTFKPVELSEGKALMMQTFEECAAENRSVEHFGAAIVDQTNLKKKFQEKYKQINRSASTDTLRTIFNRNLKALCDEEFLKFDRESMQVKRGNRQHAVIDIEAIGRNLPDSVKKLVSRNTETAAEQYRNSADRNTETHNPL